MIALTIISIDENKADYINDKVFEFLKTVDGKNIYYSNELVSSSIIKDWIADLDDEVEIELTDCFGNSWEISNTDNEVSCFPIETPFDNFVLDYLKMTKLNGKLYSLKDVFMQDADRSFVIPDFSNYYFLKDLNENFGIFKAFKEL